MPAYYEIVDGLRLPARLGGHPVLDFCNTLAGWDGHEPKEYLQSYDHLAAWTEFEGLLPPDRIASLRRQARRQASEGESLLEQARELRARLYDVLRDGPSAPAFDSLVRDVHGATEKLRLRAGDHRIQWEIEPKAGLAAPIHAVTWSAGQLLTSPDVSFVHTCPGTGCGWLFLDPRGRRRWCTMATCGNREKARRFAQRQHST